VSKVGFPPIIGRDPKVLILGSMPSEASLAQGQYYAHPRNSFWYIMGSLFEFDSEESYLQRIEQLKKNKIALWDVLQECERQGSLDSSIIGSSIKINDLSRFLTAHPTILLIAFNGATAEKEYRKNIFPGLNKRLQNISMVRLPSTSPAMATLSRDQKLVKWSVVAKAVAQEI